MNNPSNTFEFLRLYPRLTSDPVTGRAGEIYYNTTGNELRFYNGTAWMPIGSTGADRFLSNLLSPTAIPVDLLPASDNSVNVGVSGFAYASVNAYLYQGALSLTGIVGQPLAIAGADTTGALNAGAVSLLGGNTVDGSSGSVGIKSGDSSGLGNTGDVFLQIGTPTSGTAGKIKLIDGSAVVGYVWTATNIDGSGTYMAPVVTPSSGPAGAIQFSDGLGNFSSDDTNLHWNNISKRLGIRNSSPVGALDVKIAGSAAGAYFLSGHLVTDVGFAIESDGTSTFLQGTNGTLSGTAPLRLQNSGGNLYLNTLLWPTSDGTIGQFLQTNGAGVLSFATVDLSGLHPAVEYRTLTSGEATAKQITLAATPFAAAKTLLDIIGGVSQQYSVDYTVSGAVLSWSGLGLDGTLVANDVLRIVYWT